MGIGMADSGNTHAFELLTAFAIFDARNDFLVMHRQPVDADAIAVGIVARLFPMPHPATTGAIGTAAFRVGDETVGAGGYDASGSRPTPLRSRRGREELHVFG
ncbi:hypothetical protein [Sulfuricaulis sp.]|uniref:hypothetical protein n=1 Tax=Sulfuricaulis sp. TaxID=2003553 RepID=UPI003C76AEC7